MIMFTMYCIIATVVTAIFNNVGMPWWHNHFEGDPGAPPKLAFAVAYGVFWPITLFVGGPMVVCFKLTNKVLDKITKV